MYQKFSKINFLKLGQLVSLFSFLFLSCYLFFMYFYTQIHSVSSVDQSTLNPWYLRDLGREGVELPVMFVGSLIYLVVAYLLSRNLKATNLASVLTQLSISLPLVLVIIVRSDQKFFPFLSDATLNNGLIIGTAIFLLTGYIGCSLIKKRRFLIATFILLWSIIAAIILFSPLSPSFIDYIFFIGPALKMSQGEPLWSFHMQYGLLLTSAFKFMTDLQLTLSQMGTILSFTYLLWFVLYYYLASKFIKDRFLIFLFMVALLLFRYVASPAPVESPQVTPLRMDLWLPLVLVINWFGFTSLVTSFVVVLTYLADNSFGFLYLCLYVVFLMFFFYKRMINISRVLRLSLPLFCGVAVQYYLFRDFLSPAVRLYQEVKPGFVPIEMNSLFWIIFALLPYVIFIFSRVKNFSFRAYCFFLVGLSVIQLTYFFGRSHDLNLLVISGVLLLIFFMAISQVVEKYNMRKFAFISISGVIIFTNFLFAGQVFERAETIYKHLSSKKIDRVLGWESDEVAPFSSLSIYQSQDKIFILSQKDNIINYHFHFKQVDPFSTFLAHPYSDETINFLLDLLNKKYRIILPGYDAMGWVEQMNQSSKMLSSGLQFVIINEPCKQEIQWKVPIVVPSLTPVCQDLQVVWEKSIHELGLSEIGD